MNEPAGNAASSLAARAVDGCGDLVEVLGDGGAQLVRQAEDLYDPQLPYHNFSHALRAARAGLQLAGRCVTAGLALDLAVVAAALLFHDAGYRTEPASAGHPTRESFAAALATDALTAAGWDDARITAVREAILATHADAVPVTIEAVITRAGDLAELGQDYERFRTNSELLHREAELLSGVPVSIPQWVNSTIRVICGYLARDIGFPGSRDGGHGRSAFHLSALNNLHRYVTETLTADAGNT